MTKQAAARCSTALPESTVSSNAAPSTTITEPNSIVVRNPNRR